MAPGSRTWPSSRRTPESDPEQILRDALNQANTKLNKITGECDRLVDERDKLRKRTEDLKAQLDKASESKDSYKERYNQGKENYAALKENLAALNSNWVARYSELESKYNRLRDSLDASATSSSSTSATSPATSSSTYDRPREPRSSARREERVRDTLFVEREYQDKEAEKERLSRRFEDRRPPTSSRRQDAGRSGRSASANPLTRNSSKSHKPSSPLAPSYPDRYHIPRTPNPGSGAYSSGSSGIHDDDLYEDGNYHPYPVHRKKTLHGST